MRMLSVKRSVNTVQVRQQTYVERIAMLVDGANMYTTCKALNLDLDYSRLLEYIKAKGQLVRAAYFTALFDDTSVMQREESLKMAKLQKLVDWLEYNGYAVVSKQAKSYHDNATGVRKRKGNMDVELVIEAVRIASKIDRLYLFSGDGDFKALTEFLQQNGVQVTVIASKLSNPPTIADELRRQANDFIDLANIRNEVSRLRPQE